MNNMQPVCGGAFWPTGISKTEQSVRIANLCDAYVYGMTPREATDDPAPLRE